MDFVYDAFISYSHRDLKWGRWLQHKLETYPLPQEIRRARGEKGKHLHVFRDQTDLAGVELQESLQRAMESARCLIVICSPDSARSKWVGAEIRYFKKLGRETEIIPFVVAGEPESDRSELECYHEKLRNLPDKHLLGANVQELGRQKAFLRLTAILLDVRFDRLVNRARQRRQRTLLTAGGLSAAVIAVVGGLLWHNWQISRQNEVLSYNLYGAAIIGTIQADQLDGEDVENLRISAEAGNTQAMIYLADCYRHGWGIEQDLTAAFEWFLRAAETGDATAMAAVGNCYAAGEGVEADEAQMAEWYLKSADAGNPEGMLDIGICYENGTGVEQNEALALEYYLKSAEQGSLLSMQKAAGCYLFGVGTEKDPSQAFAWMQKLAQTGDHDGMYNLGMMYQYGFGTQESPEDAYLWYRRAAENGDPQAMYMTGWCLEHQYGVKSAALDWYTRAAELGSEEARERLSAESDGTAEQNTVPDGQGTD